MPENVVDGLYRRGTESLAGYLARYDWITPNRVSFAGFLVGGVGASIAILTLPLWAAGILVALGDFLDYLDGDLARTQGTGSKEGAIWDAVLDRYTDFFVIGALTYFTVAVLERHSDYFIGELNIMSSKVVLLVGLAALMGSMLTPYVRAKSEAEGKSSVATLGDRGWRDHVLVVGLLLGQPIWTLGVIALISNFSVIHRLVHALRSEKR